jgi:hypothetical protein
MKPINKAIHFFDLDGTLWNIDNKIWIIDKEKPYKPIIRLDNYEQQKILSGLYIKDKLKIEYNGEEYFISNKIFNKINKKKKISIERLGISWIEFIDDNYINNSKTDFLFKNIKHLKNKDDVHICLLTGRTNRKKHAKILNELRKKLNDNGINMYKIYFISEKFYQKHKEIISLNKIHILLEHLIGLKIKDGKFIPFKQDWFNEVYFYDDEKMNIDYANDIQKIFNRILKNTDDDLFKLVSERINTYKCILYNNLITNNDINLFDTKQIILKMPSKYPIRIKDDNHIKKYDKFIDKNNL